MTPRTLLLTDLVDSTGLAERLGTDAAADLGARHDRVARDLLAAHGGREIDKTDGPTRHRGAAANAAARDVTRLEERHLSAEPIDGVGAAFDALRGPGSLPLPVAPESRPVDPVLPRPCCAVSWLRPRRQRRHVDGGRVGF